MFGIDLLPLTTFLLLAAATPDASKMCGDKQPTKIRVIPKTANVRFDYSQSLKQLQNYETDTVDPYAYHGTTVTQAFMKGSIQPRYKILLKTTEIKKYNAGCLAYDTIEVELNIEPTIVMAKEVAKDSCLKRTVSEHELKHVRVDREVVNKYAKSIGQKLLKDLKARGFTAGPFPLDRMEEIQEKMKGVVGQILDLEFQKMSIERQERQREVDNLEEYESVNAKCPDFDRNKSKYYAEWLK